jgi:lycopene beta-cyclase
MRPDYDLILIGGGLANGLIAWRLAEARPELRVLLLEQGDSLGGNHTWSFHEGDLDSAQQQWLAPLVAHRWDSYEVNFPALRRRLHSGYASITSPRFDERLRARLGGSLRLGETVGSLTPTDVLLACGETLSAHAVIDGRGAAASPHLALGYQKFLGQEVRLAEPHGLHAPIVMDASVAQHDGYRFVYVLPFGADRLLIEDTRYADGDDLDDDALRGHIADYAATRGWRIAELLREERGVLPIVLCGDIEAFWRSAAGQPRSGLAAGLFHPTTGYSLAYAVRLADHIAGLPKLEATALFGAIQAFARQQWRRQGFFRLLNRMLFLAGEPANRWKVMQRFYGLSEGLIGRFYAARPTPLDKLRILSGKPPVPLGEALQAARASDLHRHRKHP